MPIRFLAHRGFTGADEYRREGLPRSLIERAGEVLDSGADGLEFDVRATADGSPVIYSGAELCDGRPLHSLSDEDVSSARHCGCEQCAEGIPHLSELFNTLAQRPESRNIHLNIELKGKNSGAAAAMTIRRLIEDGKLASDQFVFSSMNWEELTAVGTYMPDANLQPTLATNFIFPAHAVKSPGFYVDSLAQAYDTDALQKLHDFVTQYNCSAIDMPTWDIREDMIAYAEQSQLGFCTHPTGPRRLLDAGRLPSRIRLLQNYAERSGQPVMLKVDDIPVARQLIQDIFNGRTIDPRNNTADREAIERIGKRSLLNNDGSERSPGKIRPARPKIQ